MFQASKFVGKKLKKIIDSNSNGGLRADSSFDATIILGGQIKGGEPRIFLIYPQGNFIEVSQDNPFFQIGETKYGKPILVRGYDYEMGFSDAVKLMLLSFDSTIKANLSVGFPLDLHIYKANSFKEAEIIRIESDNKYVIMNAGDEISLKFDASELPKLKPGWSRDFIFYNDGWLKDGDLKTCLGK